MYFVKNLSNKSGRSKKGWLKQKERKSKEVQIWFLSPACVTIINHLIHLYKHYGFLPASP